MDKIKMFIFALLGLILLGFIHSRVTQPTTTVTTSKAVVVRQPTSAVVVHTNPPSMYNPYKAQYYN
jgi:ABC-type polysaccharide/polyol phosphate export permease